MKILWFSVTPSLFNPKSNSHNGGGWIASLEQIVRKDPAIELGVAFCFSNSDFKYVRDGVCYYPIPRYKPSRLQRLFSKDNRELMIAHCLRIINDFCPDLIQIFGSENDFGLLCKRTNIPIVIHMQGCLAPILNALFPVGMNKFDFIFAKGLSMTSRWIGVRSELLLNRNAEREIQTIQHCRYFMGRTEWDKSFISLINPDAIYFHCEEALRDSFLKCTTRWSMPKDNKVKIISVISPPWYKGVDLILKTSKLLKRFTNIDFEWRIYGLSDIRFFEKKYGIYGSEVNVNVMGTASKDELVDALCSSTLYVHPSYIDNSPNSVCEAQLIGLPVLAANVGGLSSIVRNGETGILFPANAPYTLASLIKKILGNPEFCLCLSIKSREHAEKRHNPNVIRSRIVEIYNNILTLETEHEDS